MKISDDANLYHLGAIALELAERCFWSAGYCVGKYPGTNMPITADRAGDFRQDVQAQLDRLLRAAGVTL